ncbi:hypothetical protein WDZ17_09540 [Pseudokineococcus basanitobsidens]|uniref:Centromere-binding protein ParB C-terminal domain-containing protein n=1 Tax=Pseudokineococcus basanitobsidens TaxID=1926649 RepID=A0ABU8RKA9_9ACTN
MATDTSGESGQRPGDGPTGAGGPQDGTVGPSSTRREKQRLRERALGALTFFYGSADHRNLPDDERRATGTPGEDVGDGWTRHGEPGHEYVTRDDPKG